MTTTNEAFEEWFAGKLFKADPIVQMAAQSAWYHQQSKLDAKNVEISELKRKPCPYVESSDEGTHYCTLTPASERANNEIKVYREALYKIRNLSQVTCSTFEDQSFKATEISQKALEEGGKK